MIIYKSVLLGTSHFIIGTKLGGKVSSIKRGKSVTFRKLKIPIQL